MRGDNIMGFFVEDGRQLKILNEASKKEVENKIKNNSESLFIHLLKLYYWGNDDNAKWHWIKEISNKYTDIKSFRIVCCRRSGRISRRGRRHFHSSGNVGRCQLD